MANAPGRGHAERREAESRLLERYAETRDPAIREELAERFMPLARSLASRYAGGTEPAEDLAQVAALGLVKAIDGFDPALGNAFASYAAPTILGELKRHFRDRTRSVRVPRGLGERVERIERALSELPATLGRNPTAVDVAEHIGIDLEEVLEAMEASNARRTLSLDAPAGRDDDGAAGELGDMIGRTDPAFEAVEYGESISRTLAGLSERERVIVHLRLVMDLTQSEIAEQVGISQMHVSRLLRRALDQVRADLGEKNVPE